jgi:hypothetical protein
MYRSTVASHTMNAVLSVQSLRYQVSNIDTCTLGVIPESIEDPLIGTCGSNRPYTGDSGVHSTYYDDRRQTTDESSVILYVLKPVLLLAVEAARRRGMLRQQAADEESVKRGQSQVKKFAPIV